MTKVNRLALSVLVVLSLAAFAAAQSYTVTDLGPGQASAINSLGDVTVDNAPNNSFVWAPDGSIITLLPLPGDSYAYPNGINSQGLVAGDSANNSSYSAVLWTNGLPLDLGTLAGGTHSSALSINASGEVVGVGDTPTTRQEAFLWTKATGMQGLGFLPGGASSIATAINRFGQVVGYSDGSAGNYGFIWSKTTGMKSLGKLVGGFSSGATAINDLGQVAGTAECGSGSGCTHAVLWSKAKGSLLDLGLLPGALFSYAEGINNLGQVVGFAVYAHFSGAFVWSPSTGMLDLNHLIPANSGWLLQYAAAINDKGQIVGFGALNGQTEAFLLTPQ